MKYIIQSSINNAKKSVWKTESRPMSLKEADKRAAERMLRVSRTSGTPKHKYRIVEVK